MSSCKLKPMINQTIIREDCSGFFSDVKSIISFSSGLIQGKTFDIENRTRRFVVFDSATRSWNVV